MEEKYRLQISELSSDELVLCLDKLSEEIIPNNNDELVSILSLGMDTFKIDEKESFTYENFQRLYYKGLHKLITLHHRFAEEGLLTDKETGSINLVKFNKLFEIFHYWELGIRSLFRVKIASDPHYDSSMNTDIGLFRFNRVDPDNNTPYQNLILYLLASLTESGIRKQSDCCMKRVYTEDGYDTHAWSPMCSIKEFVYKRTQKDVNYDQWHNLTSNPTNAKNAIKYLEDVEDPQFINVVKDRHLFSFPNGIYESCIWDSEAEIYTDRFYYYEPADGERNVIELDTKRSSCKYFDIDFVDNQYPDWYDIPTPHTQSILDYQKFPEDVGKWMYILLGRLLYEVGEMDDWQIMPFLKGVARSGKSSIVTRIAKDFFHNLDIGVLSNNCEKKFALSSLIGKFLFIAPEIKGDIGLEQCDFQTVISGEDTSVPEKFKTAKSERWIVPGIMAGNEPPNYVDNSGSVSRRLVVFNFTKKVKKANAQLGKLLHLEIPFLLQKCNRAYLEAVQRFGKKDVWDSVLPAYFKQTQEDMAQQTNALAHFLASGKLVFGEDLYCKQRDFTTALNEHVRENNLIRHSWNEDYYSSVFEERGITIERSKRRRDRNTGRNYTANWLIGLEFIRENNDDDDDLE